MKRRITTILTSMLLVLLYSCSSSEDSQIKVIQTAKPLVKDLVHLNNAESTLTKSVSRSDSEIMQKLGDWADLNKIGYGLVLADCKDGMVGCAVKCKLIHINANRFKLQALESAALTEGLHCGKARLQIGTTWWETIPDFWQTKEEALKVLKKRGYILAPNDIKF